MLLSSTSSNASYSRHVRVNRSRRTGVTGHLRLVGTALLLSIVGACGDPGTTAPIKASEMSENAISVVGSTWQVEDIDRGGIIDRSMVTVQFPEEGRITGSTGCNNYFASVSIDSSSISLSGIGTTRRACPQSLMNQEQRFLEALNSAAQVSIDDDTWLVIHDESGAERIRAIGLPEESTKQETTQVEQADKAM
jgi:heat shock protein HslJ